MTDTVITAVNGDLMIEEHSGGIRFGTDALLLADFVRPFVNAAELGSGSGIISFLLLNDFPGSRVTGIEFSDSSAVLSMKNAARNGLASRFDCICADVLDIRSVTTHGSFDCVFTNPPYLKNNCGFRNADPGKFAAFHETTAGIDGFVAAAAHLLKNGGRFCAVYRPEYLSKLLFSMESRDIRPKRLRIVYPSQDKPPCLVLAEGKKAAKDGMITEKPFYIYSDNTHKHFSSGMNAVYERFSCGSSRLVNNND